MEHIKLIVSQLPNETHNHTDNLVKIYEKIVLLASKIKTESVRTEAPFIFLSKSKLHKRGLAVTNCHIIYLHSRHYRYNKSANLNTHKQQNHTLPCKEFKMKLHFLLIAAFLSTPSFAADVAIEMLNKDADGNKMVYSQELVKIEVGDTVTWLPSSKGHNVEMISSPNKMKFKSKNGKEAKITFDTPGIYYYLCTPHKGMGMIGLVVVGNDMSNINDVKKAKAYGKSKKKLKKLLASLGSRNQNCRTG